MKKKLALLMILLSFAFAYSQEETAELDKEVTGINLETLDNGQKMTVVENVQDEALNDVDATLKSNEVKMNKEKLDLAKQQESNKDLENELSKEIASEKPLWKYILGAVLVILGAAAF